MQTFALILTICTAFSAVLAEVYYEEKFDTGKCEKTHSTENKKSFINAFNSSFNVLAVVPLLKSFKFI